MRDKPIEKYKWMYDNFKNGDKYDLKEGGRKPEMEHAGNFNYGAMGRAAGFSEQELKRGAGVYQKYRELPNKIAGLLDRKWPDKWTGSTYREEFGDPTDMAFFTPGTSYGDDQVDQDHIQDGMDSYDEL